MIIYASNWEVTGDKELTIKKQRAHIKTKSSSVEIL